MMARGLARRVSKRHSGRIAKLPRANGRTRKGAGRRAVAIAVAGVQPTRRPAVTAGPTSLRRRGRAIRVASEVSLVVALALALGASWRDGIPIDDYGLTAPISAAAGPTFVSGRTVDPGQQVMAVGSFLVPPEPPVPTARPLLLLIPALDVHRAVETVGADRSGVMYQPVNSWNAGWYKGSPVPGAPGDAVIEGHAGYPGVSMIFGRLITLKPGDQIIVVLADRTRQLFLVDSMTSVPVGTAPPGMGEPYGPARLTLLTCTGHFDKASYLYSSRLVLEAHYAGTI
jgi:hypothetical protein